MTEKKFIKKAKKVGVMLFGWTDGFGRPMGVTLFAGSLSGGDLEGDKMSRSDAEAFCRKHGLKINK